MRVLEKLKEKYKISKKTEDDIIKLVEKYGHGKINGKFKLLSKQIELGLEDHFYRIDRLIQENIGRSNSLYACKLRYGDKFGTKYYNSICQKYSHTLEKYIKKYGPIEGPIKYKEYNSSKSQSLEANIKRHGPIEGPIKYKEYWENSTFSTSKAAFVKRLGEKQGTIEYNKLCKHMGYTNTLSAYQERYGEDLGFIKYKEDNLKKSYSLSKKVMIKKMLANNNSIEEILNRIENRWSRSKATYIKKYGQEAGLIKYNNYIKKCKENNPCSIEFYRKRNIKDQVAFELITYNQIYRNLSIGKRYSKESIKNLQPIISLIETMKQCQCLYKEDEFFIRLNREEYNVFKSRMFFYDFTFIDLNLIIEYHGKHYHSDIDYNITKTINKWQDLEYDLFKKWKAEQLGFDVIIIRNWKLKEDMLAFKDYLDNRGINICIANFI